MRILITGAAGFLGSHLCDQLLGDGHEVIGMDNFVTGSPDNIAHLANNEKFSFYKRDVSNYIFVPGKVDAEMPLRRPVSDAKPLWIAYGMSVVGEMVCFRS